MSDTAPPVEPHGELVIRTIAMPADTNANGDIFGGWLLSQMDLGGAIYARNLARSRVTTVAIDAMAFLNPVYVGDIVNCHASLVKTGRTSMKVDVEAWVQRAKDGSLVRVTEGSFTYVALDEQGRPHPVHREV
jgi:acyl-CoA thioesterase YciA